MNRFAALAAAVLLVPALSSAAGAGEAASGDEALIREMTGQENVSYSFLLAVGKGEAENALAVNLLRYPDIICGGGAVYFVSEKGTVKDAAADEFFYLTKDSLYVDSELIVQALTDWDEEVFAQPDGEEEGEFADPPGWIKLPFPLLDAEDEVFLRAMKEDLPLLLDSLGGERDEETGTVYFSADGIEALLDEVVRIYETRWERASAGAMAGYDGEPGITGKYEQDPPALMSIIGEWRNKNVGSEGLVGEAFEKALLTHLLQDARDAGWEIGGSFSAGKDEVAGTYALELLINAYPPVLAGSLPETEDEEEGEVYIQLTLVSEPLEEEEAPELPGAELEGEEAEEFFAGLAARAKEQFYQNIE